MILDPKRYNLPKGVIASLIFDEEKEVIVITTSSKDRRLFRIEIRLLDIEDVLEEHGVIMELDRDEKTRERMEMEESVKRDWASEEGEKRDTGEWNYGRREREST